MPSVGETKSEQYGCWLVFYRWDGLQWVNISSVWICGGGENPGDPGEPDDPGTTISDTPPPDVDADAPPTVGFPNSPTNTTPNPDPTPGTPQAYSRTIADGINIADNRADRAFNTGWLTPNLVTERDVTDAKNWQGVNAVKEENEVVATLAASGGHFGTKLWCKDFRANIPAGAVPLGYEIEVVRSVFGTQDVSGDQLAIAICRWEIQSWEIDGVSYDSKAYSVNSQDTVPVRAQFNADGSKMYVLGTTNDAVFQYSLGTALDVSTATYDSVSHSVQSQYSNPHSSGFASFVFKPDGAKLYVVGTDLDRIYQHALSTPWDLSTASYESKSYSPVVQGTNPTSVAFNDDGSKMYVLSLAAEKVSQYTLSTPWDVSTASYASKQLDVRDELGPGYDFSCEIAFDTNGSHVFVLVNNTFGSDDFEIYQFTLSTAWDISTASYDSKSYALGSSLNTAGPCNFAFSQDGSKMYVTAGTSIWQHSV